MTSSLHRLQRTARRGACALAAAGALLAGCAQAPRTIEAAQLPQDHLYAAAPGPDAVAAEADRLFTMSTAMQRYADRVLQEPGAWRDRRQALIDALYLRDALRLSYDAETTRSAAEAFDARAGNCLSLVLMTAAFAKHLELPVSYRQVLVDDEYSRTGDLYFVSGHVNVMLGRRGPASRSDDATWLTIDFLPQIDLRGQRTIELRERTLVAMYLNNRAAESLARGQVDAAYAFARGALQRDPGFFAAANTLAVIYQRSGHVAEAEQALRFVLEREPRSVSAWANLTRLLRTQGREPHPPFHFLELGRAALQRGDAAQARDLLLRELRLQPQQHEVHFWLAQAYAALGDMRGTERHLDRAAETSPTRQARALYSAKLARLRSADRHP